MGETLDSRFHGNDEQNETLWMHFLELASSRQNRHLKLSL